ncbi:MAG TPA: GspH/FimT family pseudopilin [Steroidobacteraceae bacterium]
MNLERLHSFSSSRSHCGFTLVELLATLVIVAIVAAVSVPRLFNTQTFQERGYADELAGSLRYARKIALASGCGVAVFIDAANYSLQQRASLAACNSTGSPWSTPVRRADGTLAAGTAPSGVSVAPATTIVFDANGAVVGGAPAPIAVGPFTISIQDSGHVTVTP